MDLSPETAQHGQVCLEPCRDAAEFLRCQSQELAQFRRPARAMQMENCFAAGAHHMHMRWAVIVGVDGYPIAAESEDRGHAEL